MDYTQTFNEFSGSVGPTDLALYAGIGIVLWVLFKDKLSPVQKLVLQFVDQVKKLLGKVGDKTVVVKPLPSRDKVSRNEEDIFFDLVVSWKQTRDLAVQSGCDKAVEVADQMFPYLSPTICEEEPTVTPAKQPSVSSLH
jgi:hypothetical protein